MNSKPCDRDRSPTLIPKPKDWGPHISISGFCSLSARPNYTPEPDLTAFLGAGEPPIYFQLEARAIDSDTITKLITTAIEKTGQRALISREGRDFTDMLEKSDKILMIDDVPHKWLFERVSCVVHHGSFETTAAAITSGKPTVVVPFFGDQPFWAASIANAGASPPPIPCRDLSMETLTTSILKALETTIVERASELGDKIRRENGCEAAAKSFHQQLDIESHRCTLAPDLKAIWRLKKTDIRLSAFAAATLSNEGLLDFNDLRQ